MIVLNSLSLKLSTCMSLSSVIGTLLCFAIFKALPWLSQFLNTSLDWWNMCLLSYSLLSLFTCDYFIVWGCFSQQTNFLHSTSTFRRSPWTQVSCQFCDSSVAGTVSTWVDPWTVSKEASRTCGRARPTLKSRGHEVWVSSSTGPIHSLSEMFGRDEGPLHDLDINSYFPISFYSLLAGGGLAPW